MEERIGTSIVLFYSKISHVVSFADMNFTVTEGLANMSTLDTGGGREQSFEYFVNCTYSGLGLSLRLAIPENYFFFIVVVYSCVILSASVGE